jgi:virginiamycin B lyase
MRSSIFAIALATFSILIAACSGGSPNVLPDGGGSPKALGGAVPSSGASSTPSSSSPTPSATPAPVVTPQITYFAIPGQLNSGNNWYGITTGPDGAIWFTADPGNNVDAIGRMTTSGSFQMFSLPPLPGSPSTDYIGSIVLAPDGALWFARGPFGGSVGYIGRITTSGAYSQYSTGTSNPTMFNLVVGPDGAIWGTQPNAIGRIDMSGNTSSYPLPSGVTPSSLTTGPDGALWFTEGTGVGSVGIGRISTSGAVSIYPLPGSNNAAWGIMSGPDGSLWYAITAGMSGVQVGRMSTSGTSLSPLPVPVAQLSSFTAGSNGVVYFLGDNPSPVIGCLNAAGAGAYALQTQSLQSISYGGPSTIGPDGNLYFIYNLSIGKVSQFQPTVSSSQAVKRH